MQLSGSGLSRRDWLRLSAAGVLTTAGVPWFQAMASDASRSNRTQRKSCILLWMDGGPSQAHTFDPKPGGEFASIETKVPGIHICDCLPKLAGVMDDLALLRGMSTGEGDHYRAKYLLHTGYPRVGGFEHPAMGCIAAAEVGRQENPLPSFVTIDAGFDKGNGGRLYRSVPSYLGVKHSPLAVSDPEKGLENLVSGESDSDLQAELELLQRAEQRFAKEFRSPVVEAKQATFQRAVTLMKSSQAKAFRVEDEPEAVREAYGSHKFGKACLMARRLVEAGVSFVEIFHRGWDDHEGAAKRIVARAPWMDPAMSTLITDLKQRGMLENTLVVWMGEFGRSPVKGDGHYARAWTTVLAGAGLKTGQVIGKTDEKSKSPGGTVIERPISVPDFFATLCRALGIDHNKEVHAPGDRPIRLVDKPGTPISELF